MYRLIHLRSLSKNNFKVLTSAKGSEAWTNNKFSRKSFTLTKNFNFEEFPLRVNGDFLAKQSLSTTPSAEVYEILKKKKRRIKTKKFTELLQVTELSTKQTKTSIQKLKADKLSEFITAESFGNSLTNEAFYPNNALEYNKYNLEMLSNSELSKRIFEEDPVIFISKNADALRISRNGVEGFREILESYNAFKNCSTEFIPCQVEEQIDSIPRNSHIIEDMEEEIDILPEEEILEALELDPTIQGKDDKTKKKALSKFKSKYHKSPEHERLAKQQSLFSSLSNYLELCVASGMLNRGFGTLINYRYKYKKNSELLDIRLYNILLHGFSAKGNYSKVKEIMSIVRDDKIKYTSQTYAAVLECLGRLEDSVVNKGLIVTWLNDAQLNGIKLNDIMDKSQFVADQREIVLDAIQKIFPEFQPIYTPPILKYSNDLVNSLNQNVRPVEEDSSELKSAVNGSEIMNAKRGFSKKKLQDLAREQLSVELESVITVKSIEKFPEPTETVLHYRNKLIELQDLWRTQICVAFNRDLNTLRHQTHSKASRAVNLLPYLKALEVGKYADILMKEIRTLAEGSETYSPTVGHLYKDLGLRVQSRYHMEMKKENGILEKTGEIYGLYCDEISRSMTSDNPRQSWQRLVHQTRHSGPSMDVNDKVWPMSVMIGIGRFLYNILMRDIKIDANVVRTNSKTQNIMPAFYTLFRNQGRIVKEEVKPHPILARLFRGSQQQTLTFDACLVPMLCPPQPWSTPVNGGYLLAKSDLIRLPQQAIQQWARINEAANSDLYPSLDSLNQLASIPWKVNTNVLDVILEVFNNGGSAKLDVPQPPHALPALPKIDKNADISNVDKFQLFRQKLAHRRKQSEMYSLWCDSLYRLSLANHFRDKVFWLPHNMDFRGRVYPLPPHLNHLGSDLARSLLIFNQPQPLGPDGFDWLKLHCINLTGLKKRDSVVERLLYAEEIMDDILDSAENPLTGKMWWAKSDEPWQTLSCCVEIANVLKSPNPEEFMSCLPIHQDGSCNGLQHYAALGRDTAGAISVNLAPSQIPQDVYSLVAALVEEARLKDSANGIQVAQILESFVKRKVIKQTVMTTVYGVTRYGARLQIARQLKDIDDFPKEWVWPASTYLTTKTFESLREMFTSTKEIQDWFTDCARLISGVCGQNVEWVTPLGLKVVQPYNRFEKKSLPKNHTAGEHVSMDLYEKPNVMKQKNAFPPNFIHSLDSSHMMLTSLHSEKAGLTFVSVHDCYWTHACTVAEMNKICRQQFVALHSQPILEDLSNFLIDKYSYNEKDFSNDGSVTDLTKRKLNRVLSQLPKKGDFDLDNVLKSVYFFS